MVKRVLQIVGMVFRYAVVHGYSMRNPAAEIRPSDILLHKKRTYMKNIYPKLYESTVQQVKALFDPWLAD